MNYNAPDVYIEDVKSGSRSISQVSGSIASMVGVTKSGPLREPQLVTSWTDFISKFANGLDTPFMNDSYLAYAVYGFFSNGGNQLYINRVAKKDAKKASATGELISATASNEGVWGNDITIELKKNEDYSDENLEFDVTISLGTSDSTVVSSVYIDTIEEAVLKNSKAKNWLSDFSIEKDALEEGTQKLSGGTDGGALTDQEYVEALEDFEPYVYEITMVAIPGVETSAVRDGVLSFCDRHKLFPVISMPKGSTKEETKTYRKSISASYGALVYPWGNVSDPLTQKEKAVPPEGHYMGVCARIIDSRGVHKAPAGTEATIKGFTSMEVTLSKSDCEFLNPVGVICLLSRRNYGLVVWGARGLNSEDQTMRYVSDHFLNINIRKSLYEGTQFAVFEPNDEVLWSRLYTACKNFMKNLHTKGAFKGAGEGDAWYVVVNSTNNTEETIAEGYLNIEVGYAPVKPSEFVVIKLAHSIDKAE